MHAFSFSLGEKKIVQQSAPKIHTKEFRPPTFSLLGPPLTEPFLLLLVSTVMTLSNPFSRLPNTLVPFLFGVSSTCTWLRLSSTERHLRGKKTKNLMNRSWTSTCWPLTEVLLSCLTGARYAQARTSYSAGSTKAISHPNAVITCPPSQMSKLFFPYLFYF